MIPGGRQRNRTQYVPKPRTEIKGRARGLRRSLQIDELHAPDLIAVLMCITTVLPEFRFKVVSDAKLRSAEARAYPQEYLIKLTKSTFNAVKTHGDRRARWTIAQELGHIVLEHPKAPYRKRPGKAFKRADRLLESEANLFAAELLAPTHLARNCCTADEIRARFQISHDAAKIRLEELKKDQFEDQDLLNVAPIEAPPQQSLGDLAHEPQHVFIAIEFNEEKDRLYREILKPAVEAAGMVCRRGDEGFADAVVMDDIQRLISESDIFIAEISDFNPNVMHEIGLAESTHKPIIYICRSGYSDDQIPFNIRHKRRITYRNEAGGGPVLGRQLTQMLQDILARLLG